VLARYFRNKRGRELPIFMTRLTAPLIEWIGEPPPIEAFQAGTGFTIGDLEIQSFTIPHDALDPVGFTVKSRGMKFGLAMDLGYMPESVKFHLRGCHMMVLESNHDLEMLKVGPYPWSVKQRVMGRKGHLSNDMVGDFIVNGTDSELQTLLLGHLSEHNNHPEIVRITAQQALDRRGSLLCTTKLVVAEPGKQSEVFRLE
jgi:phosphoribosyl 1,2-cyclic phosphodiesterase